MKGLLLSFIFYGIAYYVFEALFNYISIDLLGSKIAWKEKIRLKTSISPSFWMIPAGSLLGFLLHLYIMIPLNYKNIFILILLGIVSCVIITGLELLSGLLLNIKMKLNLWNYDTKITLFKKNIPLNYKGQIDIFHSIGWFFIGYIVLVIDKILF